MPTVSDELLQLMTDRLVAELHPEAIVLFGSRAWGAPRDDSDVDLLIILSTGTGGAVDELRARRCLRGLGVAKDILVRTRDQIERSQHVPASLEAQILSQGNSSMLTPREELVRNWLVKALHDLATAHKAAAEPDPYRDTGIYHCQQAAEKAVKGFLAFHDQPPVRTHDIELLLSLADPFEGGFAAWLEPAERLTRYATQYRYPGDVMEPDQEEFDQAVADAEGLFQFVLSVLPAVLHPAA